MNLVKSPNEFMMMMMINDNFEDDNWGCWYLRHMDPFPPATPWAAFPILAMFSSGSGPGVVTYPTRWSFSFILGPLHWSSISNIQGQRKKYSAVMYICSRFLSPTQYVSLPKDLFRARICSTILLLFFLCWQHICVFTGPKICGQILIISKDGVGGPLSTGREHQ